MEPSNLNTSITELKAVSESICDRSSHVKIHRALYQKQSKELYRSVELIEETVVKQRSNLAEGSLRVAATEFVRATRSVDKKAARSLKNRVGIMGAVKAYVVQWWKIDDIMNDLEVAVQRATDFRNQLLANTLRMVTARMESFISTLGKDHNVAAKRLGIPELTVNEIEVALGQAATELSRQDIIRAESNYFQIKTVLLKKELSIMQGRTTPTLQPLPGGSTGTSEPSEPLFDFDMEKDEPELQVYEPISRLDSGNANKPAIENEAAILDTIKISHRLRKKMVTTPPSDLVGSLCDLAIALSTLRWQEEGLAICHWIKRLTHFFALNKPSFAASLNKLSYCLSRFGRYSDGLGLSQDAVEIYRELVKTKGERFQPHLARTLNNLSFRLSSAGRDDDSAEAIQAAADLYRKLNLQPELAISLHNLSSRLRQMDRGRDALRADEEAVQIYRNLANDYPAKFIPVYAKSLHNLSFQLSSVGRQQEAFKAIEEAVIHYRALAGSLQPSFSPSLAISLTNLSVHWSGFDRHDKELQAISEAVDISRQLTDLQPIKYTPLLARSSWHLVTGLTHSGHLEEAMELEISLSDMSTSR